jgi:hypothetical protein
MNIFLQEFTEDILKRLNALCSKTYFSYLTEVTGTAGIGDFSATGGSPCVTSFKSEKNNKIDAKLESKYF